VVSRRQLLLGAGALAVGGAGAEVAFHVGRGRRLLHTAGVLNSPDHHPSDRGPEATSGNFDSAAMHGPVRWRLATSSTAGAPLVLCLHGKGDNENFAMDVIRMPDAVAEAGVALNMASVDGGVDSYWHRRSSGIDPEAMVVGELLPLLLQRVGRVPVGLLGWSMGGYGALLLAGRHPDVFSALAVGSPALWPRYELSAPGAFESRADFDSHDVFKLTGALRNLPVRIDCGSDDPFVAMAKRMRADLPSVQGSISRGFHDPSYWRSLAPDQVRFFDRALRTPK
jgi:S-formylglutathione hydrolase FrmB